MTCLVRLFTFDGIHVAQRASGTGLSYDSVQLLKLPYVGRVKLTADTGGSVESDGSESSGATGRHISLAYVQVEPGKSVYYEVTPGGQETRIADTDSPILRGDATILYGPDWKISLREVA